MADPTLGLTYSDLRIRIAEFLGLAYYGAAGNQAAQLPVDAHDLDLVGRLANDGYRRFIGENPRWNFLNVPVAITFATTPQAGTVSSGSTTTLVDSSLAGLFADNTFNGYGMTITHADTSVDEVLVTGYTGASGTFTFAAVSNQAPAVGDTYTALPTTVASPAVAGQTYRYYLPDDFDGVLLTPFTYNIGGPRLEVKTVSEITIRELRAGANVSGTVSTAAYRPINTTAASTGRRWELLLWPSPASTNTITAIYKRFPQALVNTTDRSVAGFQHDDTILTACIAEAERQRGDAIGPREQAYQVKLKKSLDLDARAYSVRATEFGDRSEDRVAFGRRPLSYYGVDTYNGTRVP